jgi:flagellar biosynthesis/type III secretory pathway chaperone
MNHDTHLLEDILDREIALARRLAVVLDAERDALAGKSADDVMVRLGEKKTVLAALEAAETERSALCGAAEPADDSPPAVLGRWRVLLALMAGCRTANEVNGRIIRVRQGQTRQLLDIVRGGSLKTYGPKGQTLTSAHRALARA